MKRRLIMIISSTIVLILLVAGISYAWYTNARKFESPVIQSEDFDGLSLTLYRGYDYDFNGVLDSREELFETLDDLSSLSNDLNEQYINIEYDDAYDKITGVIDNNIITYRLLIRNETDKEYRFNPYFIFSDDSTHNKQNSMLFNLKGLNQYNHTFRNKDGDLIDSLGGDDHFDEETLKFYKYDISNGLYDTYMNPISNITDGTDIYSIEYGDSSNVVKKNGTIVSGEDAYVNLTKMYYYNAYNADTAIESYSKASEENKIYDTKLSVGTDTAPYRLEYNAYNSKSAHYLIDNLDDDEEVAIGTYYPSKYYSINKNLACLMYREKLTNMDEIVVDSYSEYYLDYYISINSELSSLNSSLQSFASLHNITPSEAIATTEVSGFNYDYKIMNNKYNEMRQYAEVSNPNFKIQSFCFDIKPYNNYSSYFKEVEEV